MMIVHLIQDLAYGNDFIKFLGDNYVKKEHFVFVTTKAKDTHIDENINCNWKYLNHKKMNELTRMAKKADLIVVHGLFVIDVILWLFMHKKLLRKVSISLWGADVYAHKQILENPKVSISVRGLDWIRTRIYRNVERYYTDNVEDFGLLIKWYGAKGTNNEVLYPSSADISLLESIQACPKISDGITRIILGNSATQTNQHMQALEMLKPYEKQNIEIYCPLSYGDQQYGKQVAAKGKELFGDKFVPIFGYMVPADYCKMLATIDVAVFNNNRQQAMGNIAILAYLGCKMFLRDDTTMWSQYVGRYGCKFHSVDEISEISFEEFSKVNKAEQRANHESFERAWDKKYLMGLWDNAFNTSLKALGKSCVTHKEEK